MSDLLKQRDQLGQQRAIKRLAVLERNHHPPPPLLLLLPLLQKNVQRLKIIIEVLPPPHIQHLLSFYRIIPTPPLSP